MYVVYVVYCYIGLPYVNNSLLYWTYRNCYSGLPLYVNILLLYWTYRNCYIGLPYRNILLLYWTYRNCYICLYIGLP